MRYPSVPIRDLPLLKRTYLKDFNTASKKA